jgi:hypothetical protein
MLRSTRLPMVTVTSLGRQKSLKDSPMIRKPSSS